MTESSTECEGLSRSKEWLIRLSREYEKVAKLIPVRLLEDGVECPQWVQQVERELALVLLPAAQLKTLDANITPRRMGALIGHSCAILVWFTEWLGAREQSLEDARGRTTAVGSAWVESWYKATRRLAKLSLCSCVDQSYEDMRDFLVGYGDAFSRKPKTLKVGELGNPTFEIYLFMIMLRKVVERMGSVRELHEALVKVFGANRIGERKRIEKICQRIGLSFRKPGRPKKE